MTFPLYIYVVYSRLGFGVYKKTYTRALETQFALLCHTCATRRPAACRFTYYIVVRLLNDRRVC